MGLWKSLKNVIKEGWNDFKEGLNDTKEFIVDVFAKDDNETNNNNNESQNANIQISKKEVSVSEYYNQYIYAYINNEKLRYADLVDYIYETYGDSPSGYFPKDAKEYIGSDKIPECPVGAYDLNEIYQDSNDYYNEYCISYDVNEITPEINIFISYLKRYGIFQQLDRSNRYDLENLCYMANNINKYYDEKEKENEEHEIEEEYEDENEEDEYSL